MYKTTEIRCKAHPDKDLIKTVDPYGLGIWYRCPMRDFSILIDPKEDFGGTMEAAHYDE